MKVGVTAWFQNMVDMQERAMSGNYDRPIPRPDFDCIKDELALCDLIEPLGFDKMWTIEHHGSPYGMTVSPTQLFSYMAGRTSRIGFGSMVFVLPWNDPIRLAGEISLLDNMLAGRDFSIGIGRGAAPQEFAAFRTEYGEARERMLEILDILRLGLTREWFSYEGIHYKIPNTSIRPQPFTPDLTQNMLMAWTSAETRDVAANSGLTPLFNNFHDWEEVKKSTESFNTVRRGHGWHDVVPTVAGPIFCSHDKEKVAQAREWVKMTYETGMWHYDLLNQPSMQKLFEGKEGAEREILLERIRERSLAVGAFGTPEECIETLTHRQALSGFGELICQVSYGLMPFEWAKESMTLFAKEVLPHIQKIEAGNTHSTSYLDIEKAKAPGDQVATDVFGILA